MRIGYVSNTIVPSRTANSINVMKMCAAMAGHGHDIMLFVPDREPREPASDMFRFYGVEPSFGIHVLPWRRIQGRSYMFTHAAVAAARRARSELVYTRLVLAAWMAALRNLDVVLELHAPPTGVMRLLLSMVGRRPQLRRVVCISAALAERISRDHPAVRDRLLIAHDAADDHPATGQSITLPGGAYLIEVGYAGHLYPGKGMEVISALARRCAWARFHVLGGLAVDIDRWSKELHDVANIVFHGFVPPARVPAYLRAVDVLLAPYQRRVSPYGGSADIGHWMSPLKLFEYMAAGRPIICSDLPTLREVLESGTTALLCDPSSIECWVGALSRLAESADERAKLAAGSRAAFEAHHTWSARAGRILDDLA